MLKKSIKKVISFTANYIGFHFIPKPRTKNISFEVAEGVLQKYSPDPQTSALWEWEDSKSDFDLTIIIPVYNVEKYLERCMESVLHQKTVYSYEVVVVNDCSPDNSRSILDKYKDCPCVKVYHHSENKGLSGARNTGLKEMHGRYVMFVDSDDYLPDNAVEDLMKVAHRLDADMVQGGYQCVNATNDELLGSVVYADCNDVPPNGVLSGMAWGKVYKAHLFSQVCFPEKYWFEDTIVTALLSHMSKRIATIADIVYFYRQNPAGITKSSKAKPKSVDTFWVHRCVLDARKELGLAMDVGFYEHLLRMIVLSYKRTQGLPEPIKMALFVLFRDMLQTARENHFVVNKCYKNLEKAILDGNYKRYAFLCKMVSF